MADTDSSILVVVEPDAVYPCFRIGRGREQVRLVHPPNESPSVLGEEVRSELSRVASSNGTLRAAVLALGGDWDPEQTFQRCCAARRLCDALRAERGTLVITARKSRDERALPALISLTTELTEEFGPSGVQIVLDMSRRGDLDLSSTRPGGLALVHGHVA